MFESPAVNLDDLPSLRCLQNFVHYDRTVKADNTDRVEHVIALVPQLHFTDSSVDDKAFAFGFDQDDSGAPTLGNGSDAEPFLIGVTTKRLRLNLRHTDTDFFHMDATFKVNQLDYSLIVCGVLDRSRTFHLVALFITSQLTQVCQTNALDHLLHKYKEVSGVYPAIKYCMGDADNAQRNAYTTVSGRSPPATSTRP
ncbi:hypothetical protein Gpo141_00000359 [Globisporangium polare]